MSTKLKWAALAAVTLTPGALLLGYWIDHGIEDARIAHQVFPWIRIGCGLSALNFLIVWRDDLGFPKGGLEKAYYCFFLAFGGVLFVMFPPLPGNLPLSPVAFLLMTAVQAWYIAFLTGQAAKQSAQDAAARGLR